MRYLCDHQPLTRITNTTNFDTFMITRRYWKNENDGMETFMLTSYLHEWPKQRNRRQSLESACSLKKRDIGLGFPDHRALQVESGGGDAGRKQPKQGPEAWMTKKSGRAVAGRFPWDLQFACPQRGTSFTGRSAPILPNRAPNRPPNR